MSLINGFGLVACLAGISLHVIMKAVYSKYSITVFFTTNIEYGSMEGTSGNMYSSRGNNILSCGHEILTCGQEIIKSWPGDTNCRVPKLKEMLCCKGTILIHNYNDTKHKDQTKSWII